MRPLALLLLLAACAPQTGVDATDDPVTDVDDDTDAVGSSHPCDLAAEQAFTAGTPWTPEQKEACFDGCETGDTQGFDQGRLTCIMGDEPCAECLPEPDGTAYDEGYRSCYPDAYERGYIDEGCEAL